MQLKTKQSIYQIFQWSWFLIALFLKVGGIDPIASFGWVPWIFFATIPFWALFFGLLLYLTNFDSIEEAQKWVNLLEEELKTSDKK